MGEAAPHLRVVDPETGEVHDSCPSCQALQDQLAGAEKDIAAWRMRYMKLERDKEREARDDPLWPRAVKLFGLWKKATGKKRSAFDASRFEMCVGLLKKHGDEMHVRGIIGIATDHFVTTRKNGSAQHHTGWDLLYRNADKWEEMVNRAPSDWRERAIAAGWQFEDPA